MAVLTVGRVAGKQEICTAEVIERSGTASPGRFRGHRENLQVPWQTCTFTCTLSQLSEITCFVCRYLRRNVKHLKQRLTLAMGEFAHAALQISRSALG